MRKRRRRKRSWVQGIYCGSVCSWWMRRHCCSWDYLYLEARGQSEEEGQLAIKWGPGNDHSHPISLPPNSAVSPEPSPGKRMWAAFLLHTSSSQSPLESG